MAPVLSCPFGELLREWRAARGFSQLDLGLAAGVSTRHLSFVETGRSRPSREMVLRLAEVLEVPLRECNAMLAAAGYAPVFRETALDAAEQAPVREALEAILASHAYPAFVLDRAWNVRLANRAHERMLALLLPVDADPGEPVNAMRLVLDPTLLRERISNWEDVAHVLGHRIRRQLRIPEPDAGVRGLLESFLEYPGVRAAMETVHSAPASDIVLPLVLELDGERLSWFSMIATIGTPRDVTLQELSIESLFPADAHTRRTVAALLG